MICIFVFLLPFKLLVNYYLQKYIFLLRITEYNNVKCHFEANVYLII